MPIRHRIQSEVLAPVADSMDSVTFEQYCSALACIDPKTQHAFSVTLPGPLMKWANEAKQWFEQIASEARMGLSDLLVLFRNRKLFDLLRGVKFDVQKIWKAITAFTKLIPAGIIKVMRVIAQSDTVQKLQSGAMKIDEVLNRYPILRRVAGFALAGLLLYMWMNMSFVGDFESDFDMSNIVDAMRGSYSLGDLFLSDQGLANLALFAVGTFTGISFIWLGSSVINILIAICYTSARQLNKNGTALKLKPLLERKKY